MSTQKWYFPVTCLVVATALISLFAQPQSGKVSIPMQTPYKAKDYSSLIGMEGFSDKALNTHFKLYQGYVTNTNLLSDTLAKLSASGKDRSPEYAELKRRFGWEFDGMRLHEYYFENLGGKNSLDTGSDLYARIEKDFGSYDNWKADFVSTGVMRGIGWAVLYLDPQSGRLMNVWINEHDVGHLAGGSPILIMDVFEHAYMIDYLTDRAQYIDAFFKNIKWDVVSERYNKVK
jgi:Fe-Mn family superoxide dismutase